MMAQGGFKRKSKAASEIPSSSLADMAFLLLIFFMVTTTFRKEKPRPLDWPEADATKKLDTPRKNILHVFLEADGQVYINDANVPMDNVSGVVSPIKADIGEELIISLRADSEVPYLYVNAVTKEFQQAQAVRVTFYTEKQTSSSRERR